MSSPWTQVLFGGNAVDMLSRGSLLALGRFPSEQSLTEGEPPGALGPACIHTGADGVAKSAVGTSTASGRTQRSRTAGDGTEGRGLSQLRGAECGHRDNDTVRGLSSQGTGVHLEQGVTAPEEVPLPSPRTPSTARTSEFTHSFRRDSLRRRALRQSPAQREEEAKQIALHVVGV